MGVKRGGRRGMGLPLGVKRGRVLPFFESLVLSALDRCEAKSVGSGWTCARSASRWSEPELAWGRWCACGDGEREDVEGPDPMPAWGIWRPPVCIARREVLLMLILSAESRVGGRILPQLQSSTVKEETIADSRIEDVSSLGDISGEIPEMPLEYSIQRTRVAIAYGAVGHECHPYGYKHLHTSCSSSKSVS